jgi:hypothetical protein
MSTATRARGHEWQFIEGMFCLTVHAGDKESSVAIPIGALLTLAADGRRRNMALHRKAMAPEGSGPEGSTPLTHDSMLPVQSWSVAPADNGMLALILDRGLDTEILLGLSPEVAETLAQLFLKHTSGTAKE